MRPEIDCDVPDLSARTADELSLAGLRLVVQPAQDAGFRERVIVLNELRLNAQILKFLLVEAFDKEAPIVAVDGKLDQDEIRNLRSADFHALCSLKNSRRLWFQCGIRTPSLSEILAVERREFEGRLAGVGKSLLGMARTLRILRGNPAARAFSKIAWANMCQLVTPAEQRWY